MAVSLYTIAEAETKISSRTSFSFVDDDEADKRYSFYYQLENVSSLCVKASLSEIPLLTQYSSSIKADSTRVLQMRQTALYMAYQNKQFYGKL